MPSRSPQIAKAVALAKNKTPEMIKKILRRPILFIRLEAGRGQRLLVIILIAYNFIHNIYDVLFLIPRLRLLAGFMLCTTKSRANPLNRSITETAYFQTFS